MGFGLRNQDFCLDLKNPKSEIRTSKYFSILTTTFWPEYAAALGRSHPLARVEANLSTDSFVFSVNEDGKAESEIRKSELFFRFLLSAFRFL